MASDKSQRSHVSLRPPSAVEHFREILRRVREARLERESSELEFALALFERFRISGRNPRIILKCVDEVAHRLCTEGNLYVTHVKDIRRRFERIKVCFCLSDVNIFASIKTAKQMATVGLKSFIAYCRECRRTCHNVKCHRKIVVRIAYNCFDIT